MSEGAGGSHDGGQARRGVTAAGSVPVSEDRGDSRRSAEANEGGPDAGNVVWIGVDPDVEIAGRPGNAMDGDGVGFDHQETRPGRQQLGENVREVVVQASTSIRGAATT